MRFLVAWLSVSVVLLQAGIAIAQVGQFPFVLTREEQLLGAVQGGVASFKGIPYAAAPVGPLRWRAPQPPPESSAIRSAYDDGPACPQSAMAGPGPLRISEDCLTLNVFRPFEFEDPLPVMVWIHGGSFVAGTASDPRFDGSKLAQAGVIVVTLNYRLGAFGWLAHPALADGGSDGGVGNLGMTDQIAALHWIHQNIAAFGGDPNNVTLFGTSSGAVSVALLMLCEPARELFQKAILESLPGRDQPHAMDMAEAVGKEFFHAVESVSPGADPRAAGADVLVAAERLLLAKPARSFGPVRDGMLVKQDIVSGFRAGRQSRIPLIIGTNDDETAVGAEPDVNAELGLAGDAVDALPSGEPGALRNPMALAARLYTDRVFTEPARFIARSHAATGAATFRYRFGYVPEAQRGDSDGGHGRELQFVFGVDGVPGAGLLMRRDREVGHLLRTYWSNFARTGDPNGSGLPLWDATSRRDRLLLIGNERIASGDDPWTERLDRLERRSR